jgi:FAD/FMN-containing dehydrogenase
MARLGRNFPNILFRQALRGAGASFGIVTSYTFRTFPAPPSATVFTYGWDLTSNAASKAFEVWQSYAASGGLPTDFGAELTLGKGSVKGKVSVRLVGAYYASNSTFGKVIQPFLAQMVRYDLRL